MDPYLQAKINRKIDKYWRNKHSQKFSQVLHTLIMNTNMKIKDFLRALLREDLYPSYTNYGGAITEGGLYCIFFIVNVSPFFTWKLGVCCVELNDYLRFKKSSDTKEKYFAEIIDRYQYHNEDIRWCKQKT